jgi:flagellar motor switch protein FliM
MPPRAPRQQVKDSLDEGIKRVALELSDVVSSKLQLLFSCTFKSKKVLNYEEFIQSLDRKYYTFSLKFGDETPILNVMDAHIIYLLTNRILGGEGIVEVRHFKDLFSYSEHYFGKQIINWMIKAYEDQIGKMELDKIADNPRYYHVFLPDEKVIQYTFEVKVGEQQVGMIYLCFDKKLSIGNKVKELGEELVT